MKTPIKFLSMIYTVALVSLILLSCAKEELVPVTASNEFITQPAKDKSIETVPIFAALDNKFLYEQVPGTDYTFAETLRSIDPDVHPDWAMDIKSFTCIRNGQTLLVYNPKDPDLNFYGTREFAVYWFKDERPIRGTNQIDCVCKGRFAAIVIHRGTQHAVGIAFYTGRACYVDEVSVANDVN